MVRAPNEINMTDKFKSEIFQAGSFRRRSRCAVNQKVSFLQLVDVGTTYEEHYFMDIKNERMHYAYLLAGWWLALRGCAARACFVCAAHVSYSIIPIRLLSSSHRQADSQTISLDSRP